MPRYVVQHGYTAARDGQRFGPWLKGDEAEMSEADAEWVNRDSPGALAPKRAEREQPPAADRQQRGGRNRSKP